MKKILKVNLVFLLSFLLLLSCKSDRDKADGTPQIKAGTAKIIGKIIIPNKKLDDNSVVEIFVPHPISGEIFKYKTAIDQSGRFSIEIDVETDISLIGLRTTLNPYNSLLVKVKSGSVTDMDIAYNPKLDVVDVQTKPKMNKYEIMHSLEIINQMIGVYDLTPEPQIALYDKSPETYINFVKASVSDKLKILNRDSLISKELKKILAKDFMIWRYKIGVFDYERSMKFNFRQMVKDSTLTTKIQKIDKSYFSFLKDFDLNNPQYLICSSFSDFQIEILKNNTLALPKIGEQDLASWLASVKGILSGVLGFTEGQYYDILAANAYGIQLNEEKRPLTEKQKKNIADHWGNGEIAKILLRKNQQVVIK